MPATLEAPRLGAETRKRNEAQAEAPPDIKGFPMYALRDSFKAALRESDQVLLTGPTGSGKTTVAPFFMREEAKTRNPNARIIVTQPRRFAVDSIAQTVDTIIGGGIVGYRYKKANTITDKTEIAFMVDMSLLNELKRNPTLEGWDAVMIDEVHRLSKTNLVLLAGLKETQALRKQRGMPPLTVVLATGTGNTDELKRYMPRLVVREVPTRLHPITPYYLDEQVEPEGIVDAAVNIFNKVLKVSPTGDKIVFMPGSSHIDETIDKLKAKYGGRAGISFYKVTGGDQDKKQTVNLKAKAAPGTIRVFVGTDVMQESITIPGVKDAIISGYKKEIVYDPRTGLSSLRLVAATQTDITQQAGRSGRDDAGNAWYLMTKGQFEGRPVFPPKSEIEHTDLTQLVLSIMGQEKDPYNFDFMKKPPKEHLDAAVVVLQKLGGLDAAGKITDMGKAMAEIPTDPHYARMLIEAKKRSCVEPVAVLVGFLSAGKSVFALKLNENFEKKYAAYIHHDSDYLTMLKIWNAYVAQPRNKRRDWAIDQGFSASVLHEAMSIKNELVDEEEFADLGVDKADKQFNVADEAFALEIQKSIASGLVDRLLELRGDNTYRLQQGGGDITPARSSIVALRAAPFVASGSIFGEPPRAGLNQPVEQAWLDEVAPYLKTLRSAEEEAEKERKKAVAEAEAERIMHEHRPPAQESRAPLEATVSPVAEKKLSFIAKIKKAIASFFARIKKFLGIK